MCFNFQLILVGVQLKLRICEKDLKFSMSHGFLRRHLSQSLDIRKAEIRWILSAEWA
jgi:hypothetical protein